VKKEREATMSGGIKTVLRWLWQVWSPVRRPICRKFNAYLADQLQHQLRAVELNIAEQNAELRELNLCAENTIRELIRLQEQLESGQFSVAGTFSPDDWSASAPVNSSQAA
jgi:hypothetical protein